LIPEPDPPLKMIPSSAYQLILRDQDVGELLGEDVGVLSGGEVAVLHSPAFDRVDDAGDQLADARLPLRRVERAPEVLLGHDVRGVLRPRLGELDVALLEGVPALLEVGDDRVAGVPLHRVEGMDAVLGEVPLEPQARLGARVDVTFPGRHDCLLWSEGKGLTTV
jgi:hypothetical protein